MVSSQGRGHLGYEGCVQVDHRGSEIPRGMCLLPHLDSPLCAYRRATLWLVEEGTEVLMGRRALGGGAKTKGDVDGGTGSLEGCIQQGLSDFHYGRYESDRS